MAQRDDDSEAGEKKERKKSRDVTTVNRKCWRIKNGGKMKSDIAQSQEGLDLTLAYKLSELRKAETAGHQLSAAELRGRREGNKTRGDDGKRKEETDRKEEEKKKKACLFPDMFFQVHHPCRKCQPS